jgi:hypothetical protein
LRRFGQAVAVAVAAYARASSSSPSARAMTVVFGRTRLNRIRTSVRESTNGILLAPAAARARGLRGPTTWNHPRLAP